jgi:hypothetical protein
MALTILIRGQLNSIPVLSDACFTKANYGVQTNSTLSVNTPRGVLGGSVAAASAGLDYTVVPGTKALEPLGLFVNDAAGAAFENAPAVASGKVAVMKGQASVEVDVYETTNEAGDADLTYAVGESLYASDQGLLTDVDSSGTIIAVCTKAPSTVSPTLGLDMRI